MDHSPLLAERTPAKLRCVSIDEGAVTAPIVGAALRFRRRAERGGGWSAAARSSSQNWLEVGRLPSLAGSSIGTQCPGATRRSGVPQIRHSLRQLRLERRAWRLLRQCPTRPQTALMTLTCIMNIIVEFWAIIKSSTQS